MRRHDKIEFLDALCIVFRKIDLDRETQILASRDMHRVAGIHLQCLGGNAFRLNPVVFVVLRFIDEVDFITITHRLIRHSYE